MSKKKTRKKRFLTVFLTVFLAVTILGILTLLGIRFLGSGGGTRTGEADSNGNVTAETEQKTAETRAGQNQVEINIESDWENESTQEEETLIPEGVSVLDTAEEGKAVFAFAGDILFDSGYSPMVRLGQRGGDIKTCFSEDLLAEMKGADLFMLNNEFTYTLRGTPTAEKQYTFRAKPETALLLKELGADLVSLANNHAYDYGEVSLLDTLDTLQETGISQIGAGRNLEEASRPAVYMVGQTRIAVIAATQIERQNNPDTKGAGENTPGVFRCWDPEKLYETVTTAKAENDFVIVYIHWGTENTDQLDWAQKEQAQKLAEAGADLIIGNHPHCLQEVGYSNGIPVIYSLGNYWFNSKKVDTCLIKAVIGEEGLESLQFLPALQEDCKTVLLNGSERSRVISYMNSISQTALIDENGYIQSKMP